MTTISQIQAEQNTSFAPVTHTSRVASVGSAPTAMADIYQDNVNIAIWERKLSATLTDAVDSFVAAHPTFQTSFTLTPDCALNTVRKSLASSSLAELSEDIARLTEMFCDLFDVERAGLRLATLDRAMCPRFHVDKLPCRLVTTYHGVATEWLPHDTVDRSKLGAHHYGKDEFQNGLYSSQADIRQLARGDIALLKGELWEGNEGGGLVHRSPAVAADANRLLLTLDFCS